MGHSIGSVDDLRAVLGVFNKYKVPVWVVSRGKNLGYGGPAPVVSGSVVLDLHRINKIIEVNEKLGYAVVEPGVTFTDLYEYCARNKLKVWPSTASLGWGSVVGNVSLVCQAVGCGNDADNIVDTGSWDGFHAYGHASSPYRWP